MDTCPTVKIKSGDSFAIINESDFDPDMHELLDAVPDYSIGKGPGGLFYVKNGKKSVSEGFKTEDDATAALAALTAPSSE